MTLFNPALISHFHVFISQSLTDGEGESTSASLLDLIRTPNMRKHTFILMFNWWDLPEITHVFFAYMQLMLNLCVCCAQVHQCCGLSRPRHALGDNRRKRLHWLSHFWLGGISCRLPYPLHHWTYWPASPIRHCEYRSWSFVLHCCFHSWQWVLCIDCTENTDMVTTLVPIGYWLPVCISGLFWLKTAVACIGRLGITMAFEMVVFVNTELYPTFVRWGN